MEYLVSPTEPPKLKFRENAIVSTLCEKMGADIIMFSLLGTILVQRKTPSDFMASITDGRLGKEVGLMVNNSSYCYLLIEGRFKYTKEGKWIRGKRVTGWTRESIEKQQLTVMHRGIKIIRSRHLEDTPTVLSWLFEWIEKGSHSSLEIRPPIKKDWFYTTKEDQVKYFYQGIPLSDNRTVAVGVSRLLFKNFPSPNKLLGASATNLSEIRGIGKLTADRIYNFLHHDS